MFKCQTAKATFVNTILATILQEHLIDKNNVETQDIF